MPLDVHVLNDIILSIMDKRTVTLLLYDGLHLVDIAGPAEAMRQAGGYDLQFASAGGAAVRAQCGLSLTADLAIGDVAGASDLLIPGGDGVEDALRDPVLLRAVANWQTDHATARLISVCSGALLLAEGAFWTDAAPRRIGAGPSRFTAAGQR